MRKSSTFLVLVVFSLFATLGCGPQFSNVRKSGLCTMGGAAIGAMVDKKNPWRGAVIGLVGGTALCVVLDNMANEANQEVMRTGQSAWRHNPQGQRIEAVPVAYNAQTRCRKIKNTAWNNGQKVGETVEEICEGQKVTNTY